MAELGTPRGLLPPIAPVQAPAGYVPPSGTGAAGTFKGFQNFNVPGFPYQNMPQQLLASMQNRPQQTYGRFGGQSPTPLPASGLLNFNPSGPTNTPQSVQSTPQSVPTRSGMTIDPNADRKSQLYSQIQQMRQAQQAPTPTFNPSLFGGLNDAQKFVYLNSLPRGSFDGNASVAPFMGANWNNIDYNGLINGTGANQLTWDFGANQIRGPQGLLSNPTLSYTYGG